MDILYIIFIGVALSMDAFAITIANCTEYGNTLTKKQEWLMPTMFAIFQGVMPLIGYFIGSLFYQYIGAYGKYLTSAIFFVLGFKMIIDIVKEKNEKDKEEKKVKKFSAGLVIIQALATSLDALVVGITLNKYTTPFYFSVIIIAVVTFGLVALALILGKSLGKLLGKYSSYVATFIILALAIKNLF